MSSNYILLTIGTIYLVSGFILLMKWRAARALQKLVYPQYIQDGTLKPTVSEDAFAPVFMRIEGPRFGLYLYISALLAPFIIVICIYIFNIVWDFFWKQAGEIPWMEVGQLPHSLMLIFLNAGTLFGTAWIAMRRYHLTAPGSLKTALRRLNGE